MAVLSGGVTRHALGWENRQGLGWMKTRWSIRQSVQKASGSAHAVWALSPTSRATFGCADAALLKTLWFECIIVDEAHNAHRRRVSVRDGMGRNLIRTTSLPFSMISPREQRRVVGDGNARTVAAVASVGPARCIESGKRSGSSVECGASGDGQRKHSPWSWPTPAAHDDLEMWQ